MPPFQKIPDRRVVIVGLGGIGSWVVQALAPFLNFKNEESWTLVLVDGDEYEEKNRARQAFDELGPKAQVQASWAARRYSRLRVAAVEQYLSADGAEGTIPISDAVRSGDIIFSCVDNHVTRKVVADHCATLRDCLLISAGNEYTDGNVQIFVRKGGESKTPELGKYHPEIQEPKDKAPHEMSCEELAASSPQLIFANFQAAALMLNAFYAYSERCLDFGRPEVYFDIVANAATPRARK